MAAMTSDQAFALALQLYNAGELSHAMMLLKQIVAHEPGHARAHNNLGIVLARTGSLHEAVDCYRRSIALNASDPDPRNNLGLAMRDLGMLEQAIDCFQQAIAVCPDSPYAHWNLATDLLLRGDFQRGWTEYEWRWQVPDLPRIRPEFRAPAWDGSPFPGKTILIHAEQGFGDTIQFSRYLPLVIERGGDVFFEIQPELVRLMQHQQSLQGVSIIARGQPLPRFDLHCPLLSLPRVFGTSLQTIPSQSPCVVASESAQTRWKRRLAEHGKSVNVGLVWAGSASYKLDRLRSPRQLQLLAPLGTVNNAVFWSLQKGEAQLQAAAPPAGLRLIDCGPELGDFEETAGLIANLDLVISSDTSAAHLAGAMGRPVWTMLSHASDWRWLLQRQDSPWYPSMRLHRQPRPGDWTSVVQAIAADLKRIEKANSDVS